MGLLSNPKTRNKIANLIACYNNKLCILCYLIGVAWFLALAYVQLNARTYFSENALLPGLVDTDFHSGLGASEFFHELKSIVKKKKSDDADDLGIPSEWLVQKFSELRLDAYVHNYSFKYPFNIYQGQLLKGQNTYAILRAPRSAGTEAVVLSAPYREDQDSTLAGIALMLGLAKVFKFHSYWAKDIIFLVTDNEEIGIEAWLLAYHHNYNDFILPGELPGRSGSIQAAVNLEIGTDLVNRMDVRVEGLNGQLPNLDLVNTVIRLCRRENLTPTLHKRADYWNLDSWDGFEHSLRTMLMMMWHQAPGVPTGNHGLFHRFNIEAVTLHGVKFKNSKQSVGFTEMGRVVEGVFRSLNNLLERFHQSFFFYLLPSTDRYISIGLYMLPFGLLILAIAIKAIALWLSAGVLLIVEDGPNSEVSSEQESASAKDSGIEDKKSNAGEKSDGKECSDSEKIPQEGFLQLLCYLPYFLMSMFFGLGAYYGPRHFVPTAISMQLSPGAGLAIGLFAVHVAVIFYPLFQKWKMSQNAEYIRKTADVRLLKCVSLLALGIILSATAVINISMAFFIAACWVPVFLLVKPHQSRIWQLVQFIFLIIISPFGLMCIAAVIHQLQLSKSSSQDVLDLASRAWEDVQSGLLIVAVQSQMLGNLTYGLITLALLPIWILFRLIPACDIPA